MTFLDRIKTAWAIMQNIEVLDAVLVKIEALGAILGRLEELEGKMASNPTLESLAERLEHLDQVVMRIENLEKPMLSPLVPTNGNTVHPVKQDLLEWNRLKLLTKFVQLADKGREIELEWQRIQQDEHDYQYAFQASSNEETQGRFLYKKGIADGVKWCVDRFS